MFIVDTHAWIEYFEGSKKAEKLHHLLLNEANEFFTIECCLAEIKGWTLRKSKDVSAVLSIVRANSRVIGVNEQDWLDAAEIRFEQRKSQKNFGLIDAILLAKQKEFRFKIISGDYHFKNLKNVIFLE